MSGAARTRCRWPPNTISAAWTRFRAIGVRPSTPSSPMPTMDNQRRGAAVSRASESPNDMRRILILGGTTEARRLAERLVERADVAVTVSLAGRTAAPATHAVPVRIGGFGGAEGLGEYLTTERVDALVDATHPYAAVISGNAADAAAATRVALLALRRPPWAALSGDRWIEVADAAAAVQALGEAPRRVFLALGKGEIRTFARAPQHRYLVRSVEPVDPPLAVPHASYVTGRGPFTEADRRDHRGRADVARSCARAPRCIDERGVPGPRHEAGLGRTDDDEGRHVGTSGIGGLQRRDRDVFVRSADRAAEYGGRRRRKITP